MTRTIAALMLASGTTLIGTGCATNRSSCTSCACVAPAGAATAVNTKTADALRETLMDERRAQAFYTSVMAKHGKVRPFSNIVYAEERHAAVVETLMNRHGVAIPALRKVWLVIPNAPEFFEQWPSVNDAMKARAPDIGKAFGQMFQALVKDGALRVKQKELIALGIGVAVRCEPCIYVHVEKSRHAGTTSAEIMEAAGLAVMMGGGPVSNYAPVVAAALDHFEKQLQA